MKKLFSIILLALLPVVASAYYWDAHQGYDAMIDGIGYKFSGNNATVSYEWYIDSEDGDYYESDYSGDVVIPESVTYNGKTYSVTSIGNNAFKGCSSLTSVTMPNTLTSIGYNAFDGCSKLTSINIPESVTSIGEGACRGCKGLTTMTIPNKVTFIDHYTFQGCTGLTSIFIPNSVTGFGEAVFRGCTSLSSITIPENVTFTRSSVFEDTPWYANQPDGLLYIGKVAYKYKGIMPADTHIEIKEGTQEIAATAFLDCTGLTSVLIPEGVHHIRSAAFKGCTGLTSITIPRSATGLEDEVFKGCSNVSDVFCYIVKPNTISDIFADVPIASALLHVPAASINAYQGYAPWNEFRRIVALPANEGEVNIGGLDYILYPDFHEALLVNGNECSSELTIPSEVSYDGQTYTVKSIFWRAFDNCNGLTKVKIPATVEGIAHSLLQEDSEETVPPKHMNPFEGCTTLESIEVDAENPAMCSDGGVLFNKEKTFLYCFPAGSLRRIYDVPETVTWIGEEAFSHNQHLTTLRMPNSVTFIGRSVCSSCASLKKVRLSENITHIYMHSFEKCENLRFIDIPENVQYLHERLFRWDTFDKIVIRGTFPAGVSVPVSIFANMNHTATLYLQEDMIYRFRYKSWYGPILPLEEYDEGETNDVVSFTQGQMATIILPTEPDASKGKYYRLDRCEDNMIVFAQELQPQARTPYIIVPTEDFSVEVKEREMEELASESVSIDGISFIGTFQSTEIGSPEGCYIDIIDTTPDCLKAELSTEMSVVGALRAYLIVKWDDPIDHGGSKGEPSEKKGIIILNDGDGIRPTPNPSPGRGEIYDLSGRRINGQSSMVNGKWSMPKGIYIENGRKVLY